MVLTEVLGELESCLAGLGHGKHARDSSIFLFSRKRGANSGRQCRWAIVPRVEESGIQVSG